MLIDHIRGFVLNPVAYIVEFETANETGNARAHLVHGQRIKLSQAIRLPPDEKRRLGNPGALPWSGQVEVRFSGPIVVQGTVKASALKFRHVMSDVVRLRPWRHGS